MVEIASAGWFEQLPLECTPEHRCQQRKRSPKQHWPAPNKGELTECNEIIE